MTLSRYSLCFWLLGILAYWAILQSVLVTIDRHEWYAPPLIYSRDDTKGLWHSKPAIHTLPMVLPSATVPFDEKTGSVEPTASLVGESGAVEGDLSRLITVAGRESGGASPSVQSGEMTGCAAQSSQANEGDLGRGESKRRRVQGLMENDNSTTDSTARRREVSPNPVQGTVDGSQGAEGFGGAIGASASLAEHVIEPTLVMIEVSRHDDLIFFLYNTE